VECSDAGKCNEENGVCECDEGYWGLACERMMCPGQCSGHGKCMTISSLGKFYTRSSKDAVAYTNWDKHKAMGCVCDYGFYGPNCGFKYCPRGDDILTSGQVDYQFQIAISSTSVMSGTVRLEFHGSSTSWSANADSESGTTCKAFMERLGSLKTVTCSQTVTDATTKSSTYTVTVNAWPFPIPHLNNIFYHEGNPPISDFVCITSDVVSSSTVSCAVTLLSDASNHKEYVSCSRRGKCTGAGDCNCIEKVGGIACDVAPVYSEVTCNEADMTVHDTCSTLTGTVINIVDVAATGTSTFSGSTSTFSGQTSYLGAFAGAVPIAFEGKVEFSDPKHLNLGIADPTQDNLIVIPNVDGTIITTANYADVVSTGTRDAVVVTGATTLSGANSFGDASTDTIDIGGTFQSSLALDGPDGGAYLQTISVVSLDGSEQTLTLPDTSGNLITTGNMNEITQMGTLSSLTASNSLTAGRLDVADSAVTQSTSATTSVSVSTSVGRITTVSLTNANANDASACTYFYVTPSNVGWSTTSVPVVNVVDYSGTAGIPSTFVASRTTSNFYLGVCNAHPTASLDGAVTIGYSFV